jgi:hypothetical protein
MIARRGRATRASVTVASLLSLPLSGGLVLLGVSCATGVSAQETSTQIEGIVADPGGKPVPNARITITHVPTGTTLQTESNAAGRFSTRGLRPGGPYRVRIEGAGYQPHVADDVYTQLGNPATLDVMLEPSELLAEISVSARAEKSVEIGVGVDFSAARVAATPTFQRDLKDVIRQDPKVVLDPTNFNSVRIAGESERYNSITIDGVRQSDDFGLNSNGYPTTRSPISLDAIDALSVQTAPYSVEYSGFQGGTINVVTKSGGNDFHGSAYYYHNSDGLAGHKIGDLPVTLSFDEKNYGASLGGPIIKDKLFFFGSYEKIKAIAPVPTGAGGAGFANSVTQVPLAVYNQIVGISRSVYNFDPLDTPSQLPETDEKALAKLDWQLTDRQRASFQYQYNNGNTVVQNNSSVSSASVGTPSNWYNRPIKQKVYTLQLFSSWTDALSTEFKAAKKDNTTGQVSLNGTNFAEFDVCVPTPGGSPAAPAFNSAAQACSNGTVFVGPDVSRHANLLTNNLETLKFKASYLAGAHTLTAGVERERLSVFNLFVPTSKGQYFFASIGDFQNRVASLLNYSNAITNNANDAAARFAYTTTALYAQDRWEGTPDFTATVGLRFERWRSSDVPLFNQTFDTLYGIPNTATLDGRSLVLPRLGFNWRLTDDTTIRGGAGLFGGGAPNVWIGNSFSNTGVITATQQITPTSPPALAAALQNVNGAQLPAAVLAAQTQLTGQGAVNALDPRFNIPSIYKLSFGIDRVADLTWLGDDWKFTTEVVLGGTRHGVLWQDLRLVRAGTAPDGRPIYKENDARPRSINDLVLTNTDVGSSLVWVIDALKAWNTRAGIIDLYAAYTYTDARDVNSGTSSTARSNWDSLAFADPNNPANATSNYETRHRFVVNFGWKKAFFGNYATAAGLFVERRSGQPFSYTFGSGTSVFGDPRQGARQHQLLYVPKDDSDYLVGGTLTQAAFDAYLAATGLDRYRGQIAPRNAFESPWWTSADVRLSQEIPGLFRGAKGVLSLDIINVANLLNNSWGRFAEVSFPYVWPVVNATIDAATGKYRYSSITPAGPQLPVYSLTPQVSVWRLNLGVRYQF